MTTTGKPLIGTAAYDSFQGADGCESVLVNIGGNVAPDWFATKHRFRQGDRCVVQDGIAAPCSDETLSALARGGSAVEPVKSGAGQIVGYAIGYGGGGARACRFAMTKVITCTGCGRADDYPLGELDETEAKCTHRFVLDRAAGKCGVLRCACCPLTISRDELLRLDVDLDARYTAAGARVADEAQRLADELKDVLAENAQLRRRVDMLERRRSK